MKRTVIFYRYRNGKCPVEEYLNSLNSKIAQKITWVLSLLEDLDIILKQYFKKLVNTDDIWECRIRLGSNSYRILGFMGIKNFIILTHGFIKKTNKTPKSEIMKAEELKRDYISRKGDKNE
jgi:phage-related protein